MLEDKETLELVEMEMRELLGHYGYDPDNTPIIAGSALAALEVSSRKYLYRGEVYNLFRVTRQSWANKH